MTKQKSNLSSQYSAFAETGFKETVEFLKEEIRELYLEDEIPWIIGYSGGKDSTAVLQLIWLAVSSLPPEKLKKPIVSTSANLSGQITAYNLKEINTKILKEVDYVVNLPSTNSCNSASSIIKINLDGTISKIR